MTEYRMGRLQLDELEAEVISLAEDLASAHVETVYVSYGPVNYGEGCDWSDLAQSKDIPVPVAELSWFVADSERRGVYELGEVDLQIEGGGVRYTLCHEGDVHCAGPDGSALLRSVRDRWRSQYPDSYAVNPHGKAKYLSDRERA
jgi:hypothetical protein